MKETPNQIRLKAWIYEGIEIELEMIDRRWNIYNAANEEDKEYYRKQLNILEKKMELVNIRVKNLEDLTSKESS